jgi:hypothetical protein
MALAANCKSDGSALRRADELRFYSGGKRWRARLCVRADARIRQMRITIPPDNSADGTIRSHPDGWLRRRERGAARTQATADQAARIVILLLAAFVALRRRMAQTDLGSGERIGNG